MKRAAIFAGLLLLLGTPSFAQSSSIGFIFGASERADDGLDFNFGNSVKEVFYAAELDEGTLLRIKAGRLDTEFDAVEDPSEPAEGHIEYIQALVEYRFYEVFGSTGVYAGPGLYRARAGSNEQTDWGFEAGLTGVFPFSRRVGILVQLGYHWVHVEERPTFFTAGAGIKINF
ncbi:MAG TPA: hypothetical protein VIL97_00950 [Thermoanaerobaculia bacterium]